MKLHSWVRRRLWVRNLWPVPLWVIGGIVGIAYLPTYAGGIVAAFVGVSALAVGTVFATSGLDRLRDQRNQIALQVTVSTVVGEELLANRMRLMTLAQAGKRMKQVLPSRS